MFDEPETVHRLHPRPMCAREKCGRLESALRVRTATGADAATIAAVTNAAFAIETFIEGTRTDAHRIAEMMRTGIFLVGTPAEELLVASVYVETRGVRGYFGLLAVDPLYRGKGIGARMVQAAEDHCRERRCTAMDISVLSLRRELLPFYHRLGYAETGQEEFRPSRPLKRGVECYSIVMSKQL